MNSINRIKEFFENKKILIVGYGKEGKSTHKFICDNKIKCEIYISDQRNVDDELIDSNVNIIDKELFLKKLEEYDIIMKTPGISFKDINVSNIRDKIYSQTEIFIKFFKNNIIGITGTKGKSTTTSLIYELFKYINKDVIICGNIGKPFFDEIDKINEETIVVCEFSSHQLEFINTSPKIAILLNIYEEHLDHYKNYDEYANAKYNIIKYQNNEDVSIINIDNEKIKELLDKNKYNNIYNNVYNISTEKETLFHMKQNKIYYNNIEIFNDDNKRNIVGNHNLFDIMVVFIIAKIYDIDYKNVYEMIKEFNGLEHRLEFVKEINNIKFYNDSISTIPETCIAALESLKNVDTLIIGGKDRGVNYKKLIEKINSMNELKVICMNDVGRKIYNEIKNEKYIIDDMSDIIKKALQITKNICLLSPAASSYGFYKNFEERGKIYKEEIKKIK